MKKNSDQLQRRIDDTLQELAPGETSAGVPASGLALRERRLADIRGAYAALPTTPSATVCRVDVPYFGPTLTMDDCGAEDVYEA